MKWTSLWFATAVLLTGVPGAAAQEIWISNGLSPSAEGYLAVRVGSGGYCTTGLVGTAAGPMGFLYEYLMFFRKEGGWADRAYADPVNLGGNQLQCTGMLSGALGPVSFSLLTWIPPGETALYQRWTLTRAGGLGGMRCMSYVDEDVGLTMDDVLIPLGTYAGGNLALGKSTKLYAQFALDEFSYGKIFTNWWGNKYAVQAGAEQYLPNLRLVAEITAVRPYTYAHFMNHTMYSHDASPLGFPQGSNVMDISLEANVIPLPFIQIDSRISYRHRGSDGNSWQDNYHDIFAGEIDTATTEWFAGSKSDEYQFISSLAIPLWGHHKLLMGHDSIRTDGWMHKLFAAWQFIY